MEFWQRSQFLWILSRVARNDRVSGFLNIGGERFTSPGASDITCIYESIPSYNSDTTSISVSRWCLKYKGSCVRWVWVIRGFALLRPRCRDSATDVGTPCELAQLVTQTHTAFVTDTHARTVQRQDGY